MTRRHSISRRYNRYHRYVKKEWRAAHNGAELLDLMEPGWYRRIDLDTLDIRSTNDCVLGQVFRTTDTWANNGCGVGRSRLGFHAADVYGSHPEALGWGWGAFGFYWERRAYQHHRVDKLNACWRQLIRQRLACAA